MENRGKPYTNRHVAENMRQTSGMGAKNVKEKFFITHRLLIQRGRNNFPLLSRNIQ
jgi:hypothetical protein